MFFSLPSGFWRWKICIGTSDFRECWSSGKTDSRNIILNHSSIFLNFPLTLFRFRSTHLWIWQPNCGNICNLYSFKRRFGSFRGSRQEIISKSSVTYLGYSWWKGQVRGVGRYILFRKQLSLCLIFPLCRSMPWPHRLHIKWIPANRKSLILSPGQRGCQSRALAETHFVQESKNYLRS